MHELQVLAAFAKFDLILNFIIFIRGPFFWVVRRPSIEHARSTVIEKAMLMELHSACMVYGGVNVRHTISTAKQASFHDILAFATKSF